MRGRKLNKGPWMPRGLVPPADALPVVCILQPGRRRTWGSLAFGTLPLSSEDLSFGTYPNCFLAILALRAACQESPQGDYLVLLCDAGVQ